ncbi:MAG: hypothetical protein CVV03_05040 [Firmicutes bacterium HGW-Firmicutes-8]|nr:MAG: hypothetical protein CVV03_05040 [Firmicutes bacterium HGW-Firmicutes-8]
MKKKMLFFCSVLSIVILLAGCMTGGDGQNKGVGQDAAPNAREQESLAQNALEDYFQVALDFSKGDYTSDTTFKKELKARYQKIMTGKLLETFYEFIDDGSIQSDYFVSAFFHEVNSQIKEIKITGQTPDTISGEADVNDDYEFSAMSDDFESPTFIDDNKVVNITQDKFNELIRQNNPIGITSNQARKYSFILVREDGTWKFKELEGVTEVTKLLEMQAQDGKKVSL